MGLDFAIDALYATGWAALDSAACEHTADGRAMPTIDTVQREFEAAGFAFRLTHVQLFDCVRAEWTSRGGTMAGAVVGQNGPEAAVYALAQLRRTAVVHA
jgi:hypothetical protein